jgi:hypothetical protein
MPHPGQSDLDLPASHKFRNHMHQCLSEHQMCRDKDGRFSLTDILDMLELGRVRARMHQVQQLHVPAS